MAFKVIKGTFHVTGYSPDGDSIRFKADKISSWKPLKGGKVKLNKKNHAQLRIEAIDTLETHYKGKSQPREFADLATNKLIKLLGIKNVVWNTKGTKVISADDIVSGYIVTRTVEKYGRPIAFVFSDITALKNIEEVYLTNILARKSINYKILSKGLAYPTFYDGMFYDLRALFEKATIKARSAQRGLWSKDKTNQYIMINEMSDITDKYVLLPKLFRRIATYLKNNNEFDANNFISQLETKKEKVLILSILHFTYLDKIVSVNPQGKIKLKYKPENLVFLN